MSSGRGSRGFPPLQYAYVLEVKKPGKDINHRMMQRSYKNYNAIPSVLKVIAAKKDQKWYGNMCRKYKNSFMLSRTAGFQNCYLLAKSSEWTPSYNYTIEHFNN